MLCDFRVDVPIVPAAIVAVGASALYDLLDTPARHYNREANSVAKEYDAWTTDGERICSDTVNSAEN